MSKSELLEYEARSALDTFDIPTTVPVLCRSVEDAKTYVDRSGRDSFVMKVAANGVLHKSRIGGVRVDVPADDVPSHYGDLDEIGRAAVSSAGAYKGVLIEPYVGSGPEVVVGYNRDDDFGPVVMLGDGGVSVEESGRVRFKAAPLARPDAEALVASWRSISLIEKSIPGHADTDLVDILMKVAGKDGLCESMDVLTLDVNPLIWTTQFDAVDAVIVVADGRERDGLSPSIEIPDLSAFLEPESIAVVGASNDESKPGYKLLRNILEFGFSGRVYPVNPRATSILGYDAYPSVSAIPAPVDKAIVLVGREHVPDVVRQCVSSNVPAVQIYSSGFAEYAEDDHQDLDGEITSAIAGTDTRVMGPNCWGAFSPVSRLTTNAPQYASPDVGNVAFVSQSGTHFVDVVRGSWLRSTPLYGALSIGNALDVSPAETCRYLLSLKEVSVLGMYLEGSSGARRLADVIRETDKPVVVLRGGRTDEGGRAAASHTAALAGDDNVWSSLMDDAGAIIVDSIDEMIELLSALDTWKRGTGPRLTLFGTGGGVGVTASDMASRKGLTVPPLPDAPKEQLSELIGEPGGSVDNPVDTTVWNVVVEGKSRLSQVLNEIGDPTIADSSIVYIEYGSVLDLNTQSEAEAMIDSIIDDLVDNPPLIPTSFVLRTGGELSSEALLRQAQARLRHAGVAVFSRIQDAIVSHSYAVAISR